MGSKFNCANKKYQKEAKYFNDYENDPIKFFSLTKNN